MIVPAFKDIVSYTFSFLLAGHRRSLRHWLLREEVRANVYGLRQGKRLLSVESPFNLKALALSFFLVEVPMHEIDR